MAKIGNKTAKDLGCSTSAWEALTQGRCNNDLTEVKAKTLTMRQIKDAAMRGKHIKAASRKFEKASHLAGKELRKLSDSWDKRTSTNVAGFFDQKKARDMKRGVL